jgi:hypothetical protein
VIQGRSVGVLVVDMAVALLLGGPSIFMVFAVYFAALPRTLVGFDVLRQITRSLELFLTKFTGMDLRLGILLPPGHRPEGFIIIDIELCGTLHRRSRGKFCLGEFLAGSDRYNLSVSSLTD